MFVKISNSPRDYAWGSRTAIAEFLGAQPSGAPEAELWLGAHAGSPSRIVEGGSAVPHYADLASWIAAEPVQALGERCASEGARLPFLLKLLAADSALSLQAHPTTARARSGFALEELAGTPRDAPHRNYKDESAKPELIVAVSETFDALSGFRPLEEVFGLLAVLRSADAASGGFGAHRLDFLESLLAGADPFRSALAGLLNEARSTEVVELVELVSSLAGSIEASASPYATSFETVSVLTGAYPEDPGIVISLLLNRVTLRRGEALFLDAGNVHAYLRGLGIELMSASDNVLRGGLTQKHVDVPELLDILDFTPMAPPYLEPDTTAPGMTTFDAGVDDFVLHRVEERASLHLTGPAIVLVESGTVRLNGQVSSVSLTQGESAYATPEEGLVAISGDGISWIATVAEAFSPTAAGLLPSASELAVVPS